MEDVARSYICFDKPVDGREDILVTGDIIQAARAVFLDPVRIVSLELLELRCQGIPWQVVLGCDGQVSCRSLLPTGIVGSELHLRGRIHVHFILVV